MKPIRGLRLMMTIRGGIEPLEPLEPMTSFLHEVLKISTESSKIIQFYF